MRLHSLALSLAAFLLLAAGPVPARADDLGAALIAAAQRDDVAEARRLLEAGAPVDAKNRYGATALFFAADRANAAMIELLLAQGATVDVVDTFYGASPLQWALFKAGESEKHRTVGKLLLAKAAKGTDEVTGALLAGVSAGDLELVKAAVETAEASPEGRRAALAAAKEKGDEAIVAYLAERTPPAPEGTTFTLPAEALPRYAGDYFSEALGLTVQVLLDGDKLSAVFPGQPPGTLAPTAADQFEVTGAPGVAIRFTAPEGAPDGPRATMTIVQGAQEFLLARKKPAPAEEPTATAAAPTAEPEEVVVRGPALPWPAFRGANRAGIGDGQGMPRSWNAETGEGLAWKTRIPGLGLSSPVVWADRVFVTTAISGTGDESLRTGLYGDVDSVDDSSVHTWKVYALDARTGSILWERVASQGAPKVKRHLKSSHANPTTATDGRYLVVSFGSEGLFCYDLDGKLLWKKDLGVLVSGWFYDPAYEWGFGSSPIVHDGAAIVQVDIQEGSFIAAFDLATGNERWRTSRDEIPTWGTPTILPGSGDGPAEIVTNGTKVRGYDAATGQELWRLGPNSEVTVGSPVIGDGLAFVVGGYPPVRPVYAIKTGSRGDLSLAEGATSSAAIPWSNTTGGSYMPSPLVYRGLLYVFNNNGRLVAYDPATGEEVYKARVGTGQGFTASPVAADGRLFFTAEDGTTYIVAAGRTYRPLGTNTVNEAVLASPAISDGRFYLRGKDHVFAFAEGASTPPTPDAGQAGSGEATSR